MSRIGKKTINIPEGVTLEVKPHLAIVKAGDKVLEVPIHPLAELSVTDNTISVTRKNDSKLARSVHGLTRTLVDNAIIGVKEGFKKDLEIIGVGYRAQVEADKLILKVGYSHEVEKIAPEGITFEVKKNIISVIGADKQLVGQVAAEIREVRKPEPYKGKGIKYVGEKIIRKVGKAVKGAGA